MTDKAHLSTHDAAQDNRNDDIKIYVNGDIVHREEAKVSVYDSGVMLGDGVWEGLRLYDGHIPFLAEQLDRRLLHERDYVPNGDRHLPHQ